MNRLIFLPNPEKRKNSKFHLYSIETGNFARGKTPFILMIIANFELFGAKWIFQNKIRKKTIFPLPLVRNGTGSRKYDIH